jgi:superfamily II RNA helicase
VFVKAAAKRIEKNIYGHKINPFDWQTNASNYKDLLIIAPTGAGKTIAGYNWMTQNNPERIIFTAPIKALSNERYFELKRTGQDVGILTGDVKHNPDAKILCMTQEIYTNSYAKMPNQQVVIDEIHYMFQDPNRARAYAEGLYKTSSQSNLLLLSATVNKKIIDYFNKVSNREFDVIEIKNRPVETIYLTNQLGFNKKLKEYFPALFFVFSISGVRNTALELVEYCNVNKMLPTPQEIDEINYLGDRYKITDRDILYLVSSGVGIYHGAMRYKEKIFIEKLFRKNLLKTVVGTDSLALGVNLPAKSVIFCQLAKYYDGPISKREFLQMSGRAGRLGLWNVGYVGFINSEFESFGYKTSGIYKDLLKSKLEEEHIRVAPNYKYIFRKIPFEDITAKFSILVQDVVEKEVDTVVNLSTGLDKTNVIQIKRVSQDIFYAISSIKRTLFETRNPKTIYKIFQDIFFDEFDISTNMSIAVDIAKKQTLDAINIFTEYSEKRTQREALQFLKFFRGLKNKYNVVGVDEFLKMINDDDNFVLNPQLIDNE